MLNVHTRNLGNATILYIQGQIVSGESDVLCRTFDSISETKAVILDLARVTILDAHGLGVMLELRERAQAKGIRLKLKNVPRLINRVLEISQLDSVFQITSRARYFPSASPRHRTSVAA
jgi:anti-sigma B factor antagonist